ncbi:MAG: Mycothiol S-conjugate amidase [Anaerolineales bacterium]|nr:Mycothiol S-conjugate amidase [Anaerolineales bacterium]
MRPLTLLCIFAHPDDESMGMGATLAKYAAEGIETHLVCATRGERGWFGPEEQNPGPGALGQLREGELRRAADALGMTTVHFLDYIDGDLDQADPVEAIGKIVTLIRSIQPQVIVTFPPDGNYGHPDHIAIGQFTQAAIVCAADASYADAKNLPPHRISKLYYMVDGENFIHFIAPLMGDMTFIVDDQTRSETAWKEWMITTRVEMSAHCATALRAIKCHQSQLATLGPLADAPEEMVAQALTMQGAFYRAFSLVNGGRKVETDLFEGLR